MAELLRSPLHERHVDLGASWPTSAAGRCRSSTRTAGVCSRSTPRCARPSASSTCRTSARRPSAAPGAREFVNACLTNDLGRIEPGKAQYTLCCDESGGVVDDLIAYLVSEDEVFLVQRGQHRRGRPAAGRRRAGRRRGDRPARASACSPCRARARPRCSAPRTAGRLDYMAYVDATFEGAAVRVCRTGYTGEHGYELIPAWEDTAVVWDALVSDAERSAAGRPGWARATRCAPKWGIRCTARTCRSNHTGPGALRRGRWAGRRTSSGDGPRSPPRRRPGRRRLLWGLEALDRGIPRAHMTCLRRAVTRSAR